MKQHSSIGHTAWLLVLAFSVANTPVEALRRTLHNGSSTIEQTVASAAATSNLSQAAHNNATAATLALRSTRGNAGVNSTQENKTESSQKHLAPGNSTVAASVINRTSKVETAIGAARGRTPVKISIHAQQNQSASSVTPQTNQTYAKVAAKNATDGMPQRGVRKPANQRSRIDVAPARNNSAQTLPTAGGTSNLTLDKARQAASLNASKLSRPSLAPHNTTANHPVHARASGGIVSAPATAAAHALTRGSSGLNRSAGSSRAASAECYTPCEVCKKRATQSGNGPYCCWSYMQLGDCRTATVSAPKHGSHICQGYDNIFSEHDNCVAASGTCCIDGRYD